MGFKHGQYLNSAGAGAYRGGWAPGDTEPWKLAASKEDEPLTRVFVTMLQQLGLDTDSFAGATGNFPELLS